MRTRELLFALAAGSGAIFALLHILGADRPHAAPPAATTADREPPPGPAADAAPAPDDGAGTAPDSAGAAPAERVPFRAAPSSPLQFAARTPPPVPPAPPAEAVGPPPEDADDLVPLLASAAAPSAHAALAARVEAAAAPDGSSDPEAVASVLAQALDRATNPVARQNLNVRMAVALPAETALPLLRALRPGGGGGDGEDALCALAFRGDPQAVRDFLALTWSAPPVDARRLVDRPADQDALAKAGERDLLRAWRCIDALLGRSYFRDLRSPPGARPPAEADALAREILPAWILRYEGHPGSDDMAWRLALAALDSGDRLEAARWASRAATLPDQDLARGAVALLVDLLESDPLEGPACRGLPDPADPARNRGLVAYIRLRRIAAERGFIEVEEEADRLAAAEPDLEVSRAWRARWAEPPPRGLDSGSAPLPAGDRLRAVEGEAVEDTPFLSPTLCTFVRWEWPPRDPGDPWSVESTAHRQDARLRPPVEVVRLPLRRTAFQLRCWSTLAELERRRAGAGDGTGRDDLLYKFGAVLFHEPGILAPPYAFGGSPAAIDPRSWTARTLAPLRAAEAFEALAAGSPGSPLAARAAYSAAQARVKASEQDDSRRIAGRVRGFREEQLRIAVEGFERFARERPSDPLAREAASAADWWRTARPRWWDAPGDP